jgi:hypothetical protein
VCATGTGIPGPDDRTAAVSASARARPAEPPPAPRHSASSAQDAPFGVRAVRGPTPGRRVLPAATVVASTVDRASCSGRRPRYRPPAGAAHRAGGWNLEANAHHARTHGCLDGAGRGCTGRTWWRTRSPRGGRTNLRQPGEPGRPDRRRLARRPRQRWSSLTAPERASPHPRGSSPGPRPTTSGVAIGWRRSR